MRPFFLLLTAVVAIMLYACDPCRNLDCASDNYYGVFKIVSASTGKDLVFGANKIYSKDEIKFYSLNGTDTSFFEYQPTTSSNGILDSVLHVYFFPKTDVAYIRLNSSDIDTLNITYKTTNTKCCGTITEITQFKYNNTSQVNEAQGIYELKK